MLFSGRSLITIIFLAEECFLVMECAPTYEKPIAGQVGGTWAGSSWIHLSNINLLLHVLILFDVPSTRLSCLTYRARAYLV